MAAKAFFFKDSNDVWAYGTLQTVDEVVSIKSKITAPNGTRARYETEGGVDYVTLLSPMMSTNFLEKTKVTEIAKNADFDLYASNTEFQTLTKDFFFSVDAAFYGGFKTVQITGDGVNTDYAMPVDCNIAAPFIINSDIYSAELVLVSGVKKIRFSEVLTDEQFPWVAYTPTVATDPTTRKKQYTAFWTQTGTDAPTIDGEEVLENDFGSLIIARTAAGTFTVTKEGAFTQYKTVPVREPYIDPETGNKIKMVRTSADVMTITTYLAADLETPADGVLTNQYIHFEIFN